MLDRHVPVNAAVNFSEAERRGIRAAGWSREEVNCCQVSGYGETIVSRRRRSTENGVNV